MKNIFFMVPIIVLFFACRTPNAAAKIWENKPPYNFTGKELPYTVVSDDKREGYIKLLCERSFFIIGNDEYIKISGGKIPAKKYIIALRALYTNLGGIYKVVQNDVADISVWYGVLGSGKKIHQTVLLVEVDTLPDNVYVSCSTAK